MKIVLAFVLFCLPISLFAQVNDVIQQVKGFGNRTRGNNSVVTDTSKKNKTNTKLDTLGFEHRNDKLDSVAVTFRYVDSTTRYSLDSSINDFDNYFDIPSSYNALSNNGQAAYSLLYKPNFSLGWQAGYQAFDLYKFTIAQTKIYRTNKPFTSVNYMIASGKEQMAQIMHTQMPKPNILSFGFDYRLINAPGFFVTQNTAHSNTRIWGHFQSKRKRFSATLIALSNVNKASENGGITNDSLLLDPNYKKRFTIPVYLGGALNYSPSPFNTSVRTGVIFKNKAFSLKTAYDFGVLDSVKVNDSTHDYLFYSRLRLVNQFSVESNQHQFKDARPDSLLYATWFNIKGLGKTATIDEAEKWNIISNEFSIIAYPQKGNLNNFLAASAGLQLVQYNNFTQKNSFANTWVKGEYRNTTRNAKWNLLLSGTLFVTGYNSGDFGAEADFLQRVSKKLGNIRLNVQLTNTKPAYIFDTLSRFYLGDFINFNKEQKAKISLSFQHKIGSLTATWFSMNNTPYFTNKFQAAQYNKLYNIFQTSLQSQFPLTKYWVLLTNISLQQKIDVAAPVNIPFLYARFRFGYDKNVFKNLNLFTGFELRYTTPFKASDYSPYLSQFVFQNNDLLHNRPDIAAFLHFRIKSFTGYLRAENLNTLYLGKSKGFVYNNFAAPNYTTPGLMIRFGIRWWFVN